MSKNFFNSFFKNFKMVPIHESNKYTFSLGVNLLFLIGGVTSHCVYALITRKNNQSKIIKKYTMVRDGNTEFMVIDEKGRHFNLNNSFWYWKWDSIEDWSNIKEGDELYFKYYGWRLPLFGLFPNIYMSDRAEFLDSMTTAQFISFENKQTN